LHGHDRHFLEKARACNKKKNEEYNSNHVRKETVGDAKTQLTRIANLRLLTVSAAERAESEGEAEAGLVAAVLAPCPTSTLPFHSMRRGSQSINDATPCHLC
jgi:hypothetical protein